MISLISLFIYLFVCSRCSHIKTLHWKSNRKVSWFPSKLGTYIAWIKLSIMLHYNLLLKLQFCLKHSIQIMFQNIKTYEAVLCTIAALFLGAVVQRFSVESCSENFPKIDGKTYPMVFFFSKVTCLTLQAISSGPLFFQRPREIASALCF